MTVIVTMAGAGSRFRAQGYEVPKHMIRARGKTLFEWSMASLRNYFDQHFIFACLKEHDAGWIKRQAAELGIRQITVAPRATISAGQAETAYDVIGHAAPAEEAWIYNIDTHIEKGLSPADLAGYQGCVHVFESHNPSMSFVRYDENDRVVELAEKKIISCWASVGVYGFSSAEIYRHMYVRSYEAGEAQEVAGERYVAPIYQLMLKYGLSLCAPRLERQIVHILGTPKEVLIFDPTAKPPFGS